jgi:hypothetical protein
MSDNLIVLPLTSCMFMDNGCIQDELDAAENVVRSRAEIRQVLIDNDRTGTGAGLFGCGEVVKGASDLYRDLDDSGTAVVMNIEMNKELSNGAEREAQKGVSGGTSTKKGSGGGGGGGAGGKKKGASSKKK